MYNLEGLYTILWNSKVLKQQAKNNKCSNVNRVKIFHHKIEQKLSLVCYTYMPHGQCYK